MAAWSHKDANIEVCAAAKVTVNKYSVKFSRITFYRVIRQTALLITAVLSVRHTGEPRQNSSRYRNAFCTTEYSLRKKYSQKSTFQQHNLSCGDIRRGYERDLIVYDDNLTASQRYEKRCEIACNLIVFTALHVIQTRYSEENSVRPSVRLSVTRVITDKMEERSIQILIPYERTFILVF